MLLCWLFYMALRPMAENDDCGGGDETGHLTAGKQRTNNILSKIVDMNILNTKMFKRRTLNILGDHHLTFIV